MIYDVMRPRLKSVLARVVLATVCASLFAACATNPNAPPDPGSKKWYQLRMTEIETAKANGELTQEQYLALKNEADATRARRLDAMRHSSQPTIGFGLGFGHIHHFHHH